MANKKTVYQVKGMHCKSCEMLIKDGVGELGGVKKIDVSLAKNTVTVEYDEKSTTTKKIADAIIAEGYTIV